MVEMAEMVGMVEMVGMALAPPLSPTITLHLRFLIQRLLGEPA